MTARPALTARTLAALLADAGLPCVTLVPDEAAAAAVPATPAEEGLRVVDGTLPVRVAYPIPPAGADAQYAALRRRDSHMMWLHDFTERQRWSARQDADDGWMTICPDPWPATYIHDGRECFRATGRPVDEDPGSWVVFWIVDDAGAWADAIQAEVTAEIARAPKARRFATVMQQQRLDSARRLRDEAPARCSVRSVEYSQARADAHVAGLFRDCPNPGVRYEAAPITAAAACRACYCPMFEAGGQWWHRTGGYPAECPGPRPPRDLPLEPGQWEFSGISMTCGYCGGSVSWPEVQRSWVRLTGAWLLGVQLMTADDADSARGRPGELVVLAETEGIARRPGERDVLPHRCTQIPDHVREQYADEIAAALCPGPVVTGSET
jgi:hypothetical protein